MESRTLKINAPNHNLALKIIPGHFATSYSHINLYIDLTSMKTRQSEAAEAAKALAEQYVNDVIVDTIVCMDGCEVIGGFLAQELSKVGILSMNAHKTIYIISPEINTNGQMIIRDNNQTAVKGKNVILLVASVTTGNTVQRSLECIQYYGGKTNGISALFSAMKEINTIPVNSIFETKDLPEYQNYNINDCPFCKDNQEIEAIVNGYGYTKL